MVRNHCGNSENKLDGRKDGAVIEVINVKIPPEKGKKVLRNGRYLSRLAYE